MPAYIIVNVDDNDLCWSNSDGWCLDNYDTFTEQEREALDLPLSGEWCEVPWGVQ